MASSDPFAVIVSPSAVHGLGYLNRREGAGASNVCASKSPFRRAGRGAAHAALNPASRGNPNPVQRQSLIPSKRLILDFDHRWAAWRIVAKFHTRQAAA
jgi:hypothetical protein